MYTDLIYKDVYESQVWVKNHLVRKHTTQWDKLGRGLKRNVIRLNPVKLPLPFNLNCLTDYHDNNQTVHLIVSVF